MGEAMNGISGKWMQKAENDLKTAGQMLGADEIITDTLCFHCQQTAEKYLNAFLVSHGHVPEKTHKIERLLAACCQFDSSFEELSDVVLLTEYAVELRYADDFFIPSIEEARNAYLLALRVNRLFWSECLDRSKQN